MEQGDEWQLHGGFIRVDTACADGKMCSVEVEMIADRSVGDEGAGE